MSDRRWWRMGVLLLRGNRPFTWTFHVRALTEARARALIEERLAEEESVSFYASVPSDPLPRAPRRDEIVADYGPYERSFDDWNLPLEIRRRSR